MTLWPAHYHHQYSAPSSRVWRLVTAFFDCALGLVFQLVWLGFETIRWVVLLWVGCVRAFVPALRIVAIPEALSIGHAISWGTAS